MNFVAQVEDHLRDLGAEARKNHPGKDYKNLVQFLSIYHLMSILQFFMGTHLMIILFTKKSSLQLHTHAPILILLQE